MISISSVGFLGCVAAYRVLFEESCGDDLGTDSVGDTSTNKHGTSKLHHGGDAHGLLESKRA